MHHVVATLADTSKVIVPIARVLTHEFRENREQRDSLNGQLLVLESKARTHIDVVCGCPCGVRLGDICEGPLRQRRVGGVEGIGIGLVDRNVNLGDSIEVWL